MFWRGFRKRRSLPEAADRSDWWRDAEAAAQSLTREAVEGLLARAASANETPDEAENEHEMIEGLERLLEVTAMPHLPVVETQHRVIGTDVCHLVAPASIIDMSGAPGKLFVTSGRVIFVGGSVTSVPWHRVRTITRVHRDLMLGIAGSGEPLHVRCNSYGDALVAVHAARQLMRP